MKQKVETPTREDLSRLEAQRSWVRNHYDEGSRGSYETVEGKLRLLDTILKQGWIDSTETVKLQSLGVTFGDAIAQQMNLTWVMVADEYGRDPALVARSSSVKVFPLTTISKRIEKGETVDVRSLFQEACATIQRLMAEADRHH